MRKVRVYVKDIEAGILSESDNKDKYIFEYDETYKGEPVSLKMPIIDRVYIFTTFPPFFDGLLPEGHQLDGLLRKRKINKYDYMSQLIAVGSDMVGSVTVKEIM